MDEIKSLFKQGHRIAEIQRRTGKCRPFIVKVLREAGLKSSKKNMSYSRGKGSESKRWDGGRHVAWNGYVRIKMPEHPRAGANGYVWEHIVVAEKKIGRGLKYFGKSDPRNEEVHHKDDDKTNNNPDNLEIMSSAEKHARHEWKTNPLKFPQSKQSKQKTPERYSEWYFRNVEGQMSRTDQ